MEERDGRRKGEDEDRREKKEAGTNLNRCNRIRESKRRTNRSNHSSQQAAGHL